MCMFMELMGKKMFVIFLDCTGKAVILRIGRTCMSIKSGENVMKNKDWITKNKTVNEAVYIGRKKGVRERFF